MHARSSFLRCPYSWPTSSCGASRCLYGTILQTYRKRYLLRDYVDSLAGVHALANKTMARYQVDSTISWIDMFTVVTLYM